MMEDFVTLKPAGKFKGNTEELARTIVRMFDKEVIERALELVEATEILERNRVLLDSVEGTL